MASSSPLDSLDGREVERLDSLDGREVVVVGSELCVIFVLKVLMI